FLLEKNADTKLGTEHLAPVILSAISLNRLKYVKKLVTAGVDVNQIICATDTYNEYSGRLNDEDNYNTHIGYDVYTPLEFAVNQNAYEIAEFLISQGADVHERDFKGEMGDSPMGIATLANNVGMIKMLIKHLMKAALENGCSESLKFLLSQPFIKINSLTNDKKSCLHFPEIWYMEYWIADVDYSLQD
ncbi:Protein of unknown function, partial [Cotesia congregata]